MDSPKITHKMSDTSSKPLNLLVQLPFSTRGQFLDIPQNRQVIHKQQIIVAHRAVFEVELSFENLKFYIVIKRKIFNKVIDNDGLLTNE